MHTGFKKQEKQLPIQFILEKLWEGASVVVTGRLKKIECSYTFMAYNYLNRFFVWRNSSTSMCSSLMEFKSRHMP